MVQDVMQDTETREDSKTIFTSTQIIISNLVRFYFSRQIYFFIYNKICQIMSDMDNFSDVNNLDVVDNFGRGNSRRFLKQ